MIESAGDVLRVSGRVTVDKAAELLLEGMDLLPRISFVDLGALTETDSSLLALLLAWVRGATGRRLSIVHAAPNVRNLARLYGVEEFLPFTA
jgi:ABC-type transporter Mla MlaB component